MAAAGGIVLAWAVLVVVAAATLADEEATTIDYRVREEQDPGTFVGNVRHDAGVDDKYDRFVVNQLRFRLLSQPVWSFALEEETGIIRTGDRIDRDSTCPQLPTCSIALDVVVLVSNPSRFLEIVKVNIQILDINDNMPYFEEVRISKKILESAMPGSGLVIPTAVDPDSTANGIQRYELISSDRMFRLDVEEKLDGSTKVLLVLQGELDREVQDFYEMRVVAHDGGDPPKSGAVQVWVTVQDANDNSPVFDNSTYEYVVRENMPLGTTIGRVHATDVDAGLYGDVLYSFSTQTRATYGKVVGINNVTGEIFVRGELDYEKHPIYTLSVTARDRGPDSLPVDATVVIRVRDVNDHEPQIKVNTLAATGVDSADITEDADIETFVAHITVTDPDSGRNGQFNCSLSDNHFQLQRLYESEYKIVTKAVLDREIRSQYNLAITCVDHGKPPKVAVKRITVIVTDVNDNGPIFSKDIYTSSLIENNYMGIFVVQANATDRDEGRNAEIRYSLDRDASDYFQIDPTSGTITARAVFDREHTQQLSFHVIAADRGQPRKKSRAQVIVTINDVNDEQPLFSNPTYSFGVYENEPAGTEVGFVHAVDADSTPYNAFEFSFAPDRNAMSKFEIDPHTGRIITKAELDREEQAIYYLIVVAKDGGVPPMSSTATVSVYVADKNDNTPVFDFPSEFNNTIHISNRAPVGYIITKVQAYDRDYGRNGNLSYVIVTGNEEGAFQMDPSSGTIAVNIDLKEINYFLYQMTIQVADNGKPPKTVTTNLNIMVNKSIAFPVAEPHILTGHNFTIVISLACVSGLVVVILIIAIICIRKNDLERRHQKYNCRMEALKMLHSREVPKDCEDSCTGKGVGMHNSNCSSGDERDKPKKEVSFNLELEDEKYGSPEKSQRSWPSTIDHRTLEHPQACSSMLNTTTASPPPPPPPPPPGVRPTTLGHTGAGSHHQLPATAPPPPPPGALHQANPRGQPWALTQRELEVHQLLQMLKQDPDADSAYSGDGSNTDSGRGPSEEGEGPRNHNESHHTGVSQHVPSQRGGSMQADNSLNSSAQVVPSLPGQSFTGSNYSYSSQPTMMRTFAPSYGMSTSPSNDFLKKTESPGSGDVCTDDMAQKARPRVFNGGDLFPKLVTPQSQVGANYIRKYYNGHHRPGYHSENDSETEGTEASDDEGGGHYSCADMSEALHGHVSHVRHVLEPIPDDVESTTTSGSYVVDPNDLCEEIDELFFRDLVV